MTVVLILRALQLRFEQIRSTATKCRDRSRWVIVAGRSPDERVVYHKVQHVWLLWFFIRPSLFLRQKGIDGRGLFAARRFDRNTYLTAYFGTRSIEQNPDSCMVMQSGEPGVLIDASDETIAPSGAQYINDPRGRRRANAKSTASSRSSFFPVIRALGSPIVEGEELLMSYNWTASEWRDAVEYCGGLRS